MSLNNSNQNLSETRFSNNLLDLIRQERIFLGIVGILFFVAGVATPYGKIAMWVGFFFSWLFRYC